MGWGRLSFRPPGARTDTISIPIGGDVDPDLEVVHALARIRLLCGRVGWDVVVRDAAPELESLLALAGLAGTLLEQGAATPRAEDRTR